MFGATVASFGHRAVPHGQIRAVLGQLAVFVENGSRGDIPDSLRQCDCLLKARRMNVCIERLRLEHVQCRDCLDSQRAEHGAQFVDAVVDGGQESVGGAQFGIRNVDLGLELGCFGECLLALPLDDESADKESGADRHHIQRCRAECHTATTGGQRASAEPCHCGALRGCSRETGYGGPCACDTEVCGGSRHCGCGADTGRNRCHGSAEPAS
ncbi:hypothetical protein [Rhodococcus sp. R1101]|uniref:hypothetical protein n=1 Tax=Rhodococcus sp. R1101 TaxID=1170698 RepID=UPI0012F7043B|nr:hypothetical protein [Rhodococcus sp. R1101]